VFLSFFHFLFLFSWPAAIRLTRPIVDWLRPARARVTGWSPVRRRHLLVRQREVPTARPANIKAQFADSRHGATHDGRGYWMAAAPTVAGSASATRCSFEAWAGRSGHGPDRRHEGQPRAQVRWTDMIATHRQRGSVTKGARRSTFEVGVPLRRGGCSSGTSTLA